MLHFTMNILILRIFMGLLLGFGMVWGDTGEGNFATVLRRARDGRKSSLLRSYFCSLPLQP